MIFTCAFYFKQINNSLSEQNEVKKTNVLFHVVSTIEKEDKGAGPSRWLTALPKRLHTRLRDDEGWDTCGSDVGSHNRRRCAFFHSSVGVVANIPNSGCSDG